MFQRTLPLLFLFSLVFFFGKNIAAQDTHEPSSYILYWGHLEGKFKWDATTNQYKTSVQVTPTDFRLSVQREPRLWTGKEILKNITFEIEDVAVAIDAENEVIYFQSRAALDKLAVRADKGVSYQVKMKMPDEKMGLLDISFLIKEVASEDKEFWQKSGLLKESVWGKPLATLTEQKEFVSHEGLMKCLADWIEYMTVLPLTSDKAAYISIVPPQGQPYEIKVPRSITKPESQERLYKKMTPAIIAPGSQVFFQVRPIDAWVGDFLLFYVARDDDPLIERHKYDRRLFGFEWGNFRYELKGYYGSSILLRDGTKKPVDPEYKQEEKSMDAAQIKQMMDLEMRVWEKGAAMNNLQYSISAGTTKYAFKAGVEIPVLIRAQLEAAVDAGQNLVFSEFQAEDMDLRNLSLIFVPKK